MKSTKCDFWLQEEHYLGHVVNKEGIHVDPNEIETLKNWKAPRHHQDSSILRLGGLI